MPYRDDGEPGLSGAASRFDPAGTRRGLPYAADPRYDEPEPDAPLPSHPDDDVRAPTAGGYGAAWEPAGGDDVGDDTGYGGDDGPPGWSTLDGAVLALPWGVWSRWRPRPWPPRRPGPRPWPPRGPWPRRPRALDRLGRLVVGARRAGSLRHRGTGTRFPVYRASLGGRSWGIVARPRGGLRGEVEEILAVRPEGELAGFGVQSTTYEAEAFPIQGAEYEAEAFPINASPAGQGASPSAPPGTTADGWRLTLPHAGVHAILSRLEPGTLRTLAGGDLPADPARAVVRGVARVARGARRNRPFRRRRGARELEVFAAPGYELLVRPTGAQQGEILLVRATAEGEEEVYGAKDPNAWRRHGKTEYRVRGARVRIQWEGPYAIPDVLRRPGGGVYVVERGGAPIYVGIATAFRTRWKDRHDALRQLGVYGLAEVKQQPWRVWLGKLTSLTTDRVDPQTLRLDVEHVLVRYLAKVRGARLTNESPINPILPAPAGIRLENIGGPAYLPPVFEYRKPEPLEIGAGREFIVPTV